MNALYTARNYQCDGVIAIGGGSVLDTGKAVSLIYDQKLHILKFTHDKSYDIEKKYHLFVYRQPLAQEMKLVKILS